MARGSIQKTKAGTYKIYVDVGRDPITGKRKRHVETLRTKREAERRVNEIIRQVETQTYVMPHKELFGDFLIMWLEEKRTQVRENTWYSYQSIIRSHITPSLGDITLSDLTPAHLSDFYKSLREKSLSSQRIRYAHVIIRSALDTALKWGMVTRNVANSVNPPRVPRKEIQVWDSEEVLHFLKEAQKDKYYIAFSLAITTGMRQSEILGLRWKDVDLKANKLYVTQVLDKHTLTFQEPKTRHSRRAIDLIPLTVEDLRRHKAIQAQERLKNRNYQGYDLVVATSNGTPVRSNNLIRNYKRIVELSGVPYIRFHDLRHVHATMLLKQGVHPKIVQERLGHSSINVTLDIYSHVLPSLQEAAAEAFSELLFNKDKSASI